MHRRTRRTRTSCGPHHNGLLIYDPAGLSPYGRQLAQLLQDLEPLLVTSVDGGTTAPGIRVRRSLPAHLKSSRLVQAGRLFRSTALVARGALTGSRVLVVWPRTLFDLGLFVVLAALNTRLAVVYHNPVPRQREGVSWQWLHRVLVRRCRVVIVHDALLARAATIETGRADARICRHPMFDAATVPRGHQRSSDACRVALLGLPRKDKGFDDVARVVTRLPAQMRHQLTLAFIGKGALPASVTASLEAAGVTVEVVGGEDFVVETRLVEELLRASALLAPYRGATASGTVMLAASLGCPVVAFRVGALAQVVRSEALAAPGDVNELAARLEGVLSAPDRDAWRSPVDQVEWNTACAREWQVALSKM